MVTRGNALVVDDEINLCRILGAKLAKFGYNVISVHDGVQAVQKVRESDFDVILLDLILPKMDGLTALAQIRDLKGAVPVIVMTACENPEALQVAKSHGVYAYVYKPFDLDNLVSLVLGTAAPDDQDRGKRLPDSTVLFAKDQPVTLEIQNGCGARVFNSRIHGKDERTLTVLAPDPGGHVLDVAPRAAVRVGLAAMDAFYSFTTHVVRSEPTPVSLLVLEKPLVIYRQQRREQGARRAMRIPAICSLLSDDDEATAECWTGETRNISEGGACIVVPEEVLPDQMLRVELRPRSEQDVARVVARVKRSRANDEPGQSGFVIGCQFTDADEAVRRLLER